MTGGQVGKELETGPEPQRAAPRREQLGEQLVWAKGQDTWKGWLLPLPSSPLTRTSVPRAYTGDNLPECMPGLPGLMFRQDPRCEQL